MEGWKKVAILGGIWGILSFFSLLAFPSFPVPNYDPQSISFKTWKGIEIILDIPASVSFVINSSIWFLMPTGRLLAITSLMTGSILIGAFLGLVVYQIYRVFHSFVR